MLSEYQMTLPLQTIETAHGPLRFMGTGFQLAHGSGKLDKPAPELGKHTDTILADLGYSTDAIAALHESKVV